MQKLPQLLWKMKLKVKKPKDFRTHQFFIGLGNPGSTYEKTRHNAGFWILDRLSDNCSSKFRKPLFKPFLKTHVSNTTLIKPLTYMNKSGTVLPLIIPKQVDPFILIITDNMDLEPGRVRIKTKLGSGSGHNGIKSIIHCFGTTPWIMTLGIGRPKADQSIVEYVLGEPDSHDWNALDKGIDLAVKSLTLIMEGDIEGGIHALSQP
jgi:PTH1 family peptidyl-tRNA hydrolase